MSLPYYFLFLFSFFPFSFFPFHSLKMVNFVPYLICSWFTARQITDTDILCLLIGGRGWGECEIDNVASNPHSRSYSYLTTERKEARNGYISTQAQHFKIAKSKINCFPTKGSISRIVDIWIRAYSCSDFQHCLGAEVQILSI